jgi:hypothetical protein
MNWQSWIRNGGALLHRDQTFVAALIALMHATSCPAVSAHVGACCQLAKTVGRKLWCLSQKFSRQNWPALGRLVERERSSGVCKCNQALFVGFDDNDHTIRGLMRFIEMTSR